MTTPWPRSLSSVLRLIGVMLLLGPVSLAAPDGWVEVDLVAAWGVELAAVPRATVSVAGQSIDLSNVPRRVELPLGELPVELQTPGLELLQATLRIERSDAWAAGGTPLVVALRPIVELITPQLLALEGGWGRVAVRARSAVPYPIPIHLRAEAADGVTHRAPSALRGVVMAGVDAELLLDVEVAADAEVMRVVVDGLGVFATVTWSDPRRAGWSLSSVQQRGSVSLGGTAQFRLEVGFTGEGLGRAQLRVIAPEGVVAHLAQPDLELLAGGSLSLSLAVEPQLSFATSLRFMVELIPDAEALEPQRLELELDVEPLPLELRIEELPTVLLPGDELLLSVNLRNPSDQPLAYTLFWSLPEWLESTEPPSLLGMLPPGASLTHMMAVQALFAPSVQSTVGVEVEVGAARAATYRELRIEPLQLRWIDPPSHLLAGVPSSVQIELLNPGVGSLQLVPRLTGRGPLAAGEAIRAGEAGGWEVPPGVSRQQIWLTPASEGPTDLAILLQNGGVTLAQRLERSFEVLAAPRAERQTRLEHQLSFSHPVDEVLLRQALPEGAFILPGSSFLDGVAIADPMASDQGALWLLAQVAAGGASLSFELSHSRALPELAPLEVAVRVGQQQRTLQGALRFSDDVPVVAAPAWPMAMDVNAAVTSSAVQLRVLEPAEGDAYRPDQALRVVVVAPAGREVVVTLNGQALGRDQLGRYESDSERGEQRLEYYGIEAQVGDNVLMVSDGSDAVERRFAVAGAPLRLEVLPLRAIADGASPIVLEVRALDAQGIPVGFGPLLIEGPELPLLPDAFPELPGYHALLRDGRAELRFAPRSLGGRLALALEFEGLRQRSSVPFEAPARLLWNAQGSLALALTNAGLAISADSLGYLEASGDFGALQIAVSAAVERDPSGVWSERLDGGFASSERWPALLAGDGPPLVSDDGVAFRYQRGNLTLGYERGTLSAPAVQESTFGSAARVTLPLAEGLLLEAGVGWLPAVLREELLTPDGTRLLLLDQPPLEESLQVSIERRRDGLLLSSDGLRLGVDYSFDRFTQGLRLLRPLWPNEGEEIELRVRVRYMPARVLRSTLAFGGGIRWVHEVGQLNVGFLRLPEGTGTRDAMALEASTSMGGLELQLRSSRRSAEAPIETRIDARYASEHAGVLAVLEHGVQTRALVQGQLRLERLGVSLRGEVGVLERAPLTGSVTASWRASEALAVELRQVWAPEGARSVLGVTYRVGEALSVATSLAYGWSSQQWRWSQRASLTWGGFSGRIEREQELSAAPSAQTTVALDWTLSEQFALEASMKQRDGGDRELRAAASYREPAGVLRGSLALTQTTRAEPVQLQLQGDWALLRHEATQVAVRTELSRELDGSGDWGGRVNLSGSTVVGAWDARAALDVTFAADTSAPKVVLDAAIGFEPNALSSVRLQAQAVTGAQPRQRLTFTVQHHADRWSLMGYQRLENSESERLLYGELAAPAQLGELLNLRPRVAYRMLLDEPDSFVVQVGLGALVAPEPDSPLRIGGVLYAAYQPATSQRDLAFGVELGYALTPEFSLVIGATFGESPGLLAGSRPGLHVRFDLSGGVR